MSYSRFLLLGQKRQGGRIFDKGRGKLKRVENKVNKMMREKDNARGSPSVGGLRAGVSGNDLCVVLGLKFPAKALRH